MKIYTRAGDAGNTQLVGGKKVEKYSLRVDCYGTIDELNSWIGLICSGLNTVEKNLEQELSTIQQELFDLGTDLATPEDVTTIPRFPERASKWLEERIDHYASELPEISQFILPGGTMAASSLHVARTITRRSERLISQLSAEETVTPEILKYINRLSDYFFVLARWVNQLNQVEDRMCK